MRHRHAISDDDRGRIKDLLPGRSGPHGRGAQDNRSSLDAVLRVARSGAPGRDSPDRFGDRDRLRRRFDRRSQEGVRRHTFDTLQDPDPAWVIQDPTAVRARPDAADAPEDGTAAEAGPIGPRAEAGAGSRPRSTSPSMPRATRSSRS